MSDDTLKPDLKENEYNLHIENIYIKDLSFEAPNTPNIFKQDWQPKVEFNLQANSVKLEGILYETTLHITLIVKLESKVQLITNTEPEHVVAYLIDLKQAGIAALEAQNQESLDFALNVTLPEILLPYAREVLSSLTVKGAFPPFMLPPINFEHVYYEQAKKGH